MAPKRPRILVADDHTLVADLCKKLLETEYDVVGTVNNGRAMVAAAAELKPDVIVVDIAMPILNGLDAGEQVKAIAPSIKLVYLTVNPDPEVAAEAFRRGATGYLLKTCAGSELLVAVREVLRGKSYISPALPGDIVNMTTSTVAFHKYRIMEVLGARSNAELVRYAVRNHIVSA